ncbi:MAG: DUF3375 family protein [Micrococcales bacterium]|nr:DUF3375 family protein [Micrococcales bacterium]
MDHDGLVALRQHHPCLATAEGGQRPLVATVLHRIFVAENARTISRTAPGRGARRRPAPAPAGGPRRVPEGRTGLPSRTGRRLSAAGCASSIRRTPTPHFDLTPAAEKALAWLGSLGERSFVGTESRLMTMYALLEQMVEGTQADPAERIRPRAAPRRDRRGDRADSRRRDPDAG